jgi:SAM-dependent MidA family methyltransferase
MALRDKLARRIHVDGALTVADFMTACLHDPEFGYYATRPRLGADGDFVTAPLVSQMFGELIGLWTLETWMRLGRPERFHLVELGPGDGTLMADVLRAARLDPAFLEAAHVRLVEASAPLRLAQKRAVTHPSLLWVDRLDEVSADVPTILFANEFLDCLPIRQFVQTRDGWSEKVLDLDGETLVWLLRPSPPALIPPAQRSDPEGSIVEISLLQEALGRDLGRRIVDADGAALLIDYGRAAAGGGDTLQALRRHLKVDPLETAGDADLTAHVDFERVAAAVRSTGAAATPILPQGKFLVSLGLEQRAAALCRRHPDKIPVIERQYARLVDEDQMGTLFKVLGVSRAGLALPGWEEASPWVSGLAGERAEP